MPLDKATVARIATLARIEVPEDELDRLARRAVRHPRLDRAADEVDTDGVEPMRAVHADPARWRADEVTDGGRPAEVLANAPATHGGYFVVPKVVE